MPVNVGHSTSPATPEILAPERAPERKPSRVSSGRGRQPALF